MAVFTFESEAESVKTNPAPTLNELPAFVLSKLITLLNNGSKEGVASVILFYPPCKSTFYFITDEIIILPPNKSALRLETRFVLDIVLNSVREIIYK
jgi:hypothetical protein